MTLLDDTCDGCGGRFDPMGDPDLTKHPEVGPYAVFCAVCQSKAEPEPTYTVTKAQYDHLVERVRQLEHLPKALEMANARAERWKRRHDLLVTAHETALAELEGLRELNIAAAESVRGMREQAWDEGWKAGADDQKAWTADTPGYRGATDNPYREA